jgi:hypothetical protein
MLPEQRDGEHAQPNQEWELKVPGSPVRVTARGSALAGGTETQKATNGVSSDNACKSKMTTCALLLCCARAHRKLEAAAAATDGPPEVRVHTVLSTRTLLRQVTEEAAAATGEILTRAGCVE